MAGLGAENYETAIPNTDALITNVPNICLVILIADCVPLLFYDPTRKVIAAVHAGWQGTIKKITETTIEKMIKEFNCSPKDIICGIGPSIGSCCFEIKKDTFDLIYQSLSLNPKNKILIERHGKLLCDLWQANKEQLLRKGILEKNIEITKLCTACNVHKFFSYRKETTTGRFGIGILRK